MLTKWAAEIADSTSEVIGYDVIITDTEGIIIGASRQIRLGSLHEQSLEVIKTNRGAAVDKTAAQKFKGTLPGVTYPIQSMTGKVVGSMAITGDPIHVKPFALIVKKQIEILLRERELQEYATNREETLQAVLHDISHFIPGISDRRMLISRAKEFGFDPSSHYISIAVDLYQFARYARLTRKRCLEEKTETPELIIQKTKNEIIKIIRMAFTDHADLSVMTGNSKYLIFHSVGGNISGREHSIYKYTNYSCRQILENLEKMKLNAAIGIGSIARNLEELSCSYQESWRALQLGKKYNQGPGIYNIQNYRVEELLASLQPALRNRFIQRNVASFRQQNDWEEVRQTFLTWCENNFSLVGAARELHIHRNTLNYRLEKIKRIGNIDLKDYRETLKLYLALRLEKFISPGLHEDEDGGENCFNQNQR